MEQLKIDFKKKINAEHRRYEQQAEIFKKHKEEAQKKQTLDMQEVIFNSDFIYKLSFQECQKRRNYQEAQEPSSSIRERKSPEERYCFYDKSQSLISFRNKHRPRTDPKRYN